VIVVDSSVWIDYLRNTPTRQVALLDRLLGDEEVLVADLALVEVLQGTRDDDDFRRTLSRLSIGEPLVVSDTGLAVQAARNYRLLRARGITVRKTVDTLIATRCIIEDLPLLYSDRDFDPFVEHLGLRSAIDLDTGVN
jgi:hypothetical protein